MIAIALSSLQTFFRGFELPCKKPDYLLLSRSGGAWGLNPAVTILVSGEQRSPDPTTPELQPSC